MGLKTINMFDPFDYLGLIRKTKTKNFQAAIDKFVDCQDSLVSLLKSVNFL